MTEREKLIDLAHDYFKSVPWYADIADLNPEELIDHLLANGVRLEAKQATSDENKRWIPVSERLPEQGQEVIVASYRMIKPVVFTTIFWNKEHDNWYGITNWMPLPEPPKEDN